MATYEFYLTDDSGRRITLLKNIAFCSISRAIKGFGTCHIGIPFQDFKVYPAFLPDRRLEIWRSPKHGATLREEGSFFLRKWNVYTRETDNVQIIEFFGRSPIDILRRQSVASDVLADYQKTDFIDDMMKEIVDENFVTPPQTVPTGELTVDGGESLGPTISHTFFSQNVLDVLKDLRDISFTLNESNDSNRRIFFDVVRGSPLNNGGYGYAFRTYADLRGTDRTGEVVFSLENGNIEGVSYYEDHLDSFTQASILNLTTPAANGSAASPESTLSRWNTIVAAQQSSEISVSLNNSKANAFIQDGKSDKSLNATILDSPGSNRQPRSLYGVDWDLGDLLPVQYAGKIFNTEVETVYVSIDEDGKENIVGITKPRFIYPPVTEVNYDTIALDSVSSTNGFANSGAAKTLSHTLGGGTNRIVIALIGISNNGGFSPTPTYNGVTMTLAKSKYNTVNWSAHIYYILDASLPVAGTYTLSVDPVTAGYGAIFCFSLTGVAQNAPEATGEGSDTAGVASWTSLITTLSENAWVVDCVASNNRTYTPDAGQTERVDVADSATAQLAGSTKPVAVAGATALGWTPSSTTSYAHALAAFAPAIL